MSISLYTDESEDDVEFEPIVVSRKSPEGRMMSKWLVAARKKLGGAFPREGARKEMDQYARKLKKFQRVNERRNRFAYIDIYIYIYTYMI
jgi:hypothetical protein